MRRFVAALIVVGLAFALAGCGGGTEEAPAEDETAAPAPAASAPTGQGELTDRSPEEPGYPAPFPAIESTETPSAIQTKLEAGRPMLIYFYDQTQNESSAVRNEIDAVLGEYRGLIDLVTFDVVITEGQAPADSAKQAALVAQDLGVTATPYVIMVDSGGFITYRAKGYVESGILEREVLRATQ
ncbi:MAG: hypothetical protein QMC79_00645 [Anaerosomatales bacterium]|nr:hypothetical protein [Anaerosomatales bacterium]